ncbi:hypothetical protein F4553_008060 [Allocatelliglobosispora scoriae]|uniref:Uncharacterized protein n=1 Tax=Allocatelliglobosispora scoriae TaxID=643052 RepID=A0A841C3W4_9ACTN|nr:SUKH-4 family immunity protein [Allocatelliglobosispora scoriae]MBB5874626.1 hypothetical protein [Allocatelliglobosispora scoriae]
MTAPMEEVTEGTEVERGLAGVTASLTHADNEFLTTWGLPRFDTFQPLAPDEVTIDKYGYFAHVANLGTVSSPMSKIVLSDKGKVLSCDFDRPGNFKYVNTSMVQFATTMWRYHYVSEILVEMNQDDENFYPGLQLFWQYCCAVDHMVDLDSTVSYWQGRVETL